MSENILSDKWSKFPAPTETWWAKYFHPILNWSGIFHKFNFRDIVLFTLVKSVKWIFFLIIQFWKLYNLKFPKMLNGMIYNIKNKFVEMLMHYFHVINPGLYYDGSLVKERKQTAGKPEQKKKKKTTPKNQIMPKLCTLWDIHGVLGRNVNGFLQLLSFRSIWLMILPILLNTLFIIQYTIHLQVSRQYFVYKCRYIVHEYIKIICKVLLRMIFKFFIGKHPNGMLRKGYR